jgi:hypothetical protein
MVKKLKKMCEFCSDIISNINDNINEKINEKGINEKNIYFACSKCINNNSYINISDNKDIDYSSFYLKIFIYNNFFYVILNEWKDYLKNLANKKKEEIRKKEIDKALKEYKLENIKPSLYKSYIKYGVPNIENIILTFKKEQDKKEERLYNLIKELKKKGREYDENIPVFEKYLKDDGDICKIIEEGELEKSLIYHTNYKNYLKHNSVPISRYLAAIEFMNSGKKNDIVNKFVSEKNTLNFH